MGADGPDRDAALDYLAVQELGGFEALLALIAVEGKVDVAMWPSPDDPLLDRLVGPETYPGLLRLAIGWSLNGYDPHDFRGVDLVERIWQGYDTGNRSFGSEPSLVDDALALRALALAGEPFGDLAPTVDRLMRSSAPDGGWSWDGGPVGDTDVTVWVVQGLEAAGVHEPVWEDWYGFLEEGRAEDGSYSSLGVGPNCQSTGIAIQGYHAMGLDAPPASLAYLSRCQQTDGGFSHTPDGTDSDLWATLDILPGLM